MRLAKRFLTTSRETRSIAKHIGLSSIYKGGSILIAFLLVPLSISYLGNEKYGLWLTIYSFIGWFNFFDFGIGHGLRNKLTEAWATKNINLAKMLNHFLELCTKYNLKIPPDFFLMIKAFTSMEGVARKLDPDFDMIAHAVPYVRAAKYRKLNPSRIAREFMDIARGSYKLLQNIPEDATEIIRLTKSGNLSFKIKIEGLEKMLNTQDQTSNRVSFAIIIAALILGSAILINSKVPPIFFNVSVIGIAGFIAAAVMGIWLLVAIIQKGRL